MSAKIFVTPLMRAVWHEMCARALKEWHEVEARAAAEGSKPEIAPLPNVAPAVAIIIGSHFNNNTAETFVGQETVAKALGISPRLVWASIHGYRVRDLLVVRHCGRRSNFCAMPLKKVAAECELYQRKARSRVRDFPQERSQKPVAKFAAGCERSPVLSEQTNSSRAPERPGDVFVIEDSDDAKAWSEDLRAHGKSGTLLIVVHNGHRGAWMPSRTPPERRDPKRSSDEGNSQQRKA
jgi:hypothetical protein